MPKTLNTSLHAAAERDRYRSTLTLLLNLLAEGQVKAVVGQRLPLVEAARGQRQDCADAQWRSGSKRRKPTLSNTPIGNCSP